ncbi:Uncharacterized conserved protein YjdB, contains Ig-like domain [Anaerobranca californiensis DSM 14826]|uniref:Uncharacterized conserved protein YjdB, contains Ig-like domain n=1 Tax=Anaerobranca californiensis DSM 14826 TaxID=1120989 RepID=A0A1M6K6W3_9FIRM|nr:Ig-like domain-containing protein [Anaerobranca californiensis]SHJ54736.1 Uncharacterized conserved protein YjdB, contains Ig-like domain [Anaerobranca californiensis DSM 14826]
MDVELYNSVLQIKSINGRRRGVLNMKRLKKGFLILLITGLIFNLISFPVEAQSSGRLVVSMPNQGYVGNTITVNINIDNFSGFGVSGIAGYQFNLNYNGSVLRPRLQGSTYHKAGPLSSGYMITSNLVENSIRVAAASASPNINRNGTLLSFQFEIIGGGSSNVTLTNIVLDGVPANRISVSNGSISTSHYVAPTGITLNKTSLNLNVGESERLTATVSPNNATDKRVEWSSTNRNVATVDSNGNVRAVGPGTATINAKTVAGNRVATATVRVTAPVTGVSIGGESKILLGDTQQLIANITPANASNKNVSWSSSNPSILSVDGNGNVTAKGIGEAIITVTTEDGNKKATKTITVVSEMPLEGIKAKNPSIEIMLGDTFTPELEFIPKNATNKKVNWQSSDSNVVKVDSNGNLFAVGVGETTVKGVSEDGGHEVVIEVKVLPIPEEKLVETYFTISENSHTFELPKTLFFKNDYIQLKDERITVKIPKELIDSTFAANDIINYDSFKLTVNKVNPAIPENYRVLSPVYEFKFEVDGRYIHQFAGEVIKTITFDPTLVQNIQRVSLYWFNEETKEWEKIDSQIDETKGLVHARVNHWSLYVLLEDLGGKGLFNFSGSVSFSVLIFMMLLTLVLGIVIGYMIWGFKKPVKWSKGV